MSFLLNLGRFTRRGSVGPASISLEFFISAEFHMLTSSLTFCLERSSSREALLGSISIEGTGCVRASRASLSACTCENVLLSLLSHCILMLRFSDVDLLRLLCILELLLSSPHLHLVVSRLLGYPRI